MIKKAVFPTVRLSEDGIRPFCFASVPGWSEKQQDSAYGSDHAADHADNAVNLLRIRVVLFLSQIVDTCTENENADDETDDFDCHYFSSISIRMPNLQLQVQSLHYVPARRRRDSVSR